MNHIYENVPEEMRSVCRWVCHENKKPVNPLTGRGASSVDSAHWVDFHTALENVRRFDGLSFALGGGFVGIDGDHVSFEELFPVVEMLGSYAEVSPSGEGIHIFLKGKKPGERCRKGKWECYETGRFLTVTGIVIDDRFPDVVEHQDGLAWFYRQYIDDGKRVSVPMSSAGCFSEMLPSEIISRIRSSRQGGKFSLLFDDGGPGLNPSSADLSLLNLLCFWCQGDAGMMEEIFSMSALGQREKWRNRPDYRQRTLKAALSSWNGQRYLTKREYRKQVRAMEQAANFDRVKRMMTRWN